MKKILSLLLMLLCHFSSVAQGEFITVWDMSKPGSDVNQIGFGLTYTAPVAYTWTASGGGTGSGTTTGTITGLPAGETITLHLDPVNLKAFFTSSSTDRQRLINLTQWGTTAWSSMKNTFFNCVNLKITATDVPDLSGVTDMSRMFMGCSPLSSIPNINSWDTSNVTNMESLFWGVRTFNQNIGNWDTSNVTDMGSLFWGVRTFNQSIGNWDTSNVTKMNSMFEGARDFNQNIGNWNTSNVTDMGYMFWNTAAFNQDIGNWDTANVTDMNSMFSYTTAFNQNIGNWDTSKVTNMIGMFDNATAFNQDIGNWNTTNVTNMPFVFLGATAFNQNLSNWKLNSVTDMSGMLDNSGMDCANYSATLMGWADNTNTPDGISLGAQGKTYGTNAVAARAALMAKNWTINGDSNSGTSCTPPRPFITVWDMSKPGSSSNQITFNLTYTAPVAYTWTASGGSTGSGTTTGTITGLPAGEIITLSLEPASLQAISFDSPIISTTTARRLINVAQWGTVAWRSMALMFNGCSFLNITATDVPDLSKVTNMASMFNGCTVLNSPANMGSWDTSNVTNMSFLFSGAIQFNQNIGNWNTANVTDMSKMFNVAPSFNQDIGNWNTANVTNMDYMFSGAMSFKQNIGSWDTSKVTDMRNMFSGALSFNQNISNWNTANVTDMSQMFNSAMSFNQNIGNWNTANVTDMNGMFSNATAFNQNIGTWNTSKVTDMSQMFTGAKIFNQNIGNWDTANVTSMSLMFSDATAFNQNIGTWNTSKVTDMSQMFTDAKIFNQDIGNWDTANVTSMNGLFFGATAFNQNIGNWDTANVNGMANMFTDAVAFNQNIGTWNTSKVMNMIAMFSNATAFNQNLSNWQLNSVTEMTDMLDNSGMDCTNYSLTLMGWADNPDTPNAILLGAEDILYGTNAIAARNTLTATKGWTITGDSNSGNNCANTQTLTVADMTKTYGDAPFVPNATASSGLEVSYESADNSIAEVFQDSTDGNKWKLRIHKAGIVTITAKQTGNSLYEPAPDVPFILTINKAVLNVTADVQTKVYGSNDPVWTYQTNGFVYTDTQAVLSGTLSRAAGEAVGTYSITQGTLDAANYSITYTGADFTITKAILNIVADANTKVYGTTDPLLTYTVTGLTNGDDINVITGTLTRAAGENIGTYAIEQGTLAITANYDIVYTGADFSITKAQLFINADTKSKPYGTTDPVLTYMVTGLTNGDDPSIISGDLERETGEAVGTYGINFGSIEISSPNYDIVYTSEILSITKATLNIVADAKTKVYGTTDPVLTYTMTGLVNGDDANILTGNLTRIAGENIGTYLIGQGTLAATANYDIAYTSADFTITKATLNIAAEAKTKVYGTTDPALTYTITGLINGDDANIITGNLTRTAGENIGTYTIEQGTLAATTNYDIAYTSADFTISKATLNIVAEAKTKQLGTADPALTYTVTGLVNGDDANVITGALSRTAGENIGTYAIEIGTLDAMNYSISYTGAHFSIVDVLLVNSFTQSDITCNGANNGSATVVVTGGTTPYTYNWMPTGGTEAIANGLTAGTYTVTITDANGFVVTQEFTITEPAVVAPPTAESVQTFCASQNITIGELQAQGSQVKWYATADAMTELPADAVLTDGTYYASQTINGCESTEKTAVQVTISELPESSTGAATQSFTVDNIGEATIADLVMDQENVIWYLSHEDAMTGNNPLTAEMPLENGQTYYAVLMNTNGCSSLPTAVTVDITLSTDEFDKSGLKYYPNPTSDILTIEYKNSMDRVTVYNLLGQRVLTQEANGKEVQLNMSGLANGSYMIEIRSKKQTQFVKVVKK